jgi:hypothetical protein
MATRLVPEMPPPATRSRPAATSVEPIDLVAIRIRRALLHDASLSAPTGPEEDRSAA